VPIRVKIGGISRMPRTGWTPSIVPGGADQTVYLVVDNYGSLGTAYRETDVERIELETVITDLLSGQSTIRSASSLSTRLKRATSSAPP
jgi:hypothetical protein